MHYEIKYDLDDIKAEAQAIKDIKSFWGVKHFNKVAKMLAEDHGRSNKQAIYLGLGCCGVSGYPAKVMIDKYWSPQMRLNF